MLAHIGLGEQLCTALVGPTYYPAKQNKICVFADLEVQDCISMGIFSPLPRLNSHSDALSSHSHPIPIPMADLIPIPKGIPWDPWDPRPMGSHAHL